MPLAAWILITAVAAGALGALVAWALTRARFRGAAELAEARCADLRAQLEQQRAWVEERTRHFEQSVAVAAARAMEERARAQGEASKREVEAVVEPFRQQLAEFRRRVDEIHSLEASARGALDQKIVQLTALNQAVSAQAERLTQALTVSSKSTGDWGETILARILEDSGLHEGREYRLQYTVRGAEGDVQRPDAVIFLPESRQLVIDAKVSNKAWTAYCGDCTSEEKAQYLREHLASLRAHMKGLAAREYPGSPDLTTVDFVLMFVPVEAALLTAFQHDAALYGDAYRQRIILVTPSTLMAVIKLVEGIWTFERRRQSADEIAEAGRKLYEKLAGFAGTFMEVGAAIGKADAVYQKALGQLSTGRGNAIALAEKMRTLGVSPAAGKRMPDALLGGADGEEGEGEGSGAPTAP